MGKQIAASSGPEAGLIDSSDWVGDVSRLFDPEMVSTLHGRLFILGVAKLDKELWKSLDTLLLDAGENAYRRTFMKLLQNRPTGPSGSKPRTKRCAGSCWHISRGK